MTQYRLTVDTGGTFSDFVYLDEATGDITVAKLPSTPDDPSRAILSGLEVLLARGATSDDIRYFCHGTTVGTNALLEEKGVHTGLLITEGFRGIYEVGEQCRPYGAPIFDIAYDRPRMLVTEADTGEAVERISAAGEILLPLDEAALRATVRALREQGVVSIAVCFLFSFLMTRHEVRARAIIEEEIPGCGVSLSSDIVPQIREYYRLSTTVINAYLQPILAVYIGKLEERLADAGVTTPQKYVMQSNGGMATFASSTRKAVATVLSGPAGGVAAGIKLAQSTGYENLVTFDMGGTSCDVALIKNGAAAFTNRGKIEGRDIGLPMLDINTVSAGGGTLARADRFGMLEVGPHSAGAMPGPACYNRGGREPTITDCNLVLGYLGENNFLGGKMTLDAGKARDAIADRVAKPLNLSVTEAAEGIVRIIDVKMEEAIKAISTMRGEDLRDFHLLAFGGAGPLHAARMAAELGMKGVIVPLYPGVFSALGLMMSEVKHDYIQSRLSLLAKTAPGDIAHALARLEAAALEELGDEGFAKANTGVERFLDMRYAGQGYEISVPCDHALEDDALMQLRLRFDEMHQRMFGHAAPAEPVEIVSYRLRGVGHVAPVTIRQYQPAGIPLARALRETRRAYFGGVAVECPVYQREKLDVGVTFSGPAIVDQLDCTTVLPPGFNAGVDEFKNILITLGA